MFDTHTHCCFSHDSITQPEDMIIYAINKGLDYIAFTDHCDKDLIMLKEFDWVRQIDLPNRFEHLYALQRKYQDKITVGVGLECGFRKNSDHLYKEILNTYPTDIIINSIHIVEDEDCYYNSFFEKRTKEQSYSQYLCAVRKSLDCDYDYDVVGHLGYVSRRATYDKKYFDYASFANQIDDILLTIINKNKALEINTHSRGTESDFLPTIEILQRYKELGGKLITFASDSHIIDRIGEKYQLVCDMLKNLGFEKIYKYVKHIPIAVNL